MYPPVFRQSPLDKGLVGERFSEIVFRKTFSYLPKEYHSFIRFVNKYFLHFLIYFDKFFDIPP